MKQEAGEDNRNTRKSLSQFLFLEKIKGTRSYYQYPLPHTAKQKI